MSNPNYKKQPVNRVPDNLLRLILTKMDRALQELSAGAFDTGGGGSGSGGGTTLTTGRTTVRWVANGPYQVGTDVDGAWVCPAAMTIFSVRLSRTTPGSSGSSIVDIHKNGTTIYTTQANRPTIAYDDSDEIVQAVPPDIQTVAAGDKLTMDIDQIEGGKPADLCVMMEGM